MRTKASKPSPILSISLAATCLVAVLFLAACGAGSGGDSSSPPPNYAKELAGSPPKLAAIHKQANQLLPGGTDALNSRISSLKGYPAVVNVWGSWCAPCRSEFPHFQKASANLGKKVAFLGVDSDDSASSAKDFLKEAPLSYPSYSDNDKSIANSLDATFGLPATAFFNSKGEKTYTKDGQYTSVTDLENDIKTYAINGQTGS